MADPELIVIGMPSSPAGWLPQEDAFQCGASLLAMGPGLLTDYSLKAIPCFSLVVLTASSTAIKQSSR
jgi:hypothetical protein